MKPDLVRGLGLAALLVLVFFAARDFSRLGEALPWRTMDDFPDFYCAGQVLDRGASPYTYEPLRTCEHAVNAGTTFRGRLFAANPAIAIPAPQPAYDFLPLILLARMPFAAARMNMAIAITLATVACMAGLVALGVPVLPAAAMLVLSALYASLNTGQIIPFALLALVLCGVALARGRDGLAGIFAALTAIEPTLGLPVILATFFFVPRARWVLAAMLAALAAGAISEVGLHGALAYVANVLPAHAASELHFPFQYSLTYVLAFFGTPESIALLAGGVSYAAFVIGGLLAAPSAARRYANRELLVFLPALACVIGGTFVHQEELCFAIPALAIVTFASRGRGRVIGAAALCILSIPWIAVWSERPLLLSSVLVCVVILAYAGIGWRPATVTIVLIAAALFGFERLPPHLPVPHLAPTHPYLPGELVQRVWRDYTDGRSSADPAWLAIKLPTWAALLTVLGIAVGEARR